MDRRALLKIGAAAGAVAAFDAVVPRAWAEQGCSGQLCASYIPIARLAKIYAPQYMSEWCWAASISMLLGYYGHPVGEDRIVRDAYGVVANMPGAYPQLIGSLNRPWVDDRGRGFRVRVNGMFAPEMGLTQFSNQDIANALDNNDPLLYCTLQHAMVLTAIKYIGSSVVEGWVMDPWPGNGLRRLSQPEMMPMPIGQLRMVATVAVGT